MNDLIKSKVNELFLACLDNGFHFNYSAHVNSLTVMPITFNGVDDYVLFFYNFAGVPVSDALEQLESAIKTVKGE